MGLNLYTKKHLDQNNITEVGEIMSNKIDFLISKVRYNDEHTHIIKVISHKNTEKGFEKGFEETREKVISKLKDEKIYFTIYKKPNGKWKKGEKVHIIKIKNKEYIRTDNNKTEKDNLGNLPEF